MAFNLTANINARLANGGSVAAQLRKQLSANPIAIDVKLSGSATKASRQLTDSLKGLNAQIRAVSANSRTAASAINQLSASFTKFKSGTQQLIQTAAAAKKIKKETKEATDSIAEFGRVSGLALRRNTGFLLATGAVYGLGRAITSSFGEAIRFEKELVKIAQVSNRSVSSLKPLADEITRLSTTLGVASADLVDVSLILAQAGLSANETRQALDALAKTTLAATFGSIQDTTEGAIALMAQFEISAKDLGKALGATNAVSAAFAVESEDIIAAVKRAGGVFAQTSKGVTSSLGAFNEFIAVFSAVRATTRESAESIATGLRTIFTRIQRPATIQFLKELGIELTDLNGRFVGPFEAVNRLSQGLEGLDRRGSSFARVAEELGGFRQIGKTLALLSSSTQRIQALQVAQQGQNSVNKDAEQAQQSLANAIQKTREEFTALIREIAGTKTFDVLVRTVLAFANSFIKLADAIKPVIPLLAALAAVKGIGIASSFLPSFKKSLGTKGFAVGGRVSGGKGGVDDIPAMLTAGEYVINKKSANMIGKEKLDDLNRVGFAKGGPVGRIRMNKGGDIEEAKRRLRAAGLDESKGNISVELQRLKRERAEAAIGITKNDPRLGEAKKFSNRPGSGVITREMLFLEDSMKGSTGRAGTYVASDNSESPSELNQLRKLDKNLGKGQGARKERARLQKSLRDKTLRNETTDPSLLGIGRGGITPRFEANLGGRSVSGNSGATLTGNLSETKLQERIAQQNKTRLEKNKRFNAEQARLQEKELNIQAENVRIQELAKENNRQAITGGRARQGLPQFTGTGGLAGIQSQQTIDPAIAALRQEQALLQNARKPPSVTGSRTTSIRDVMRTLNAPVGRTPLSPLELVGPGALFGTSQNVTSNFRGRGNTNNIRSRLLKGAKTLGVPGFASVFGQGGSTGNLLGIREGITGKISSAGTRLSRNLSRFGAAGLVGGLALGDKVGGSFGGAISGAAGGAGAGALVAGAPGAAIGAVVGALNGFVQARLDEKIKKSSDEIIKSVTNVEEAFTKFDSLGPQQVIKSLPELNKSFNDIARTAGNSAKTDFSSEAPSFVSKFGLLTEAAFTSKTFGGITRDKSNQALDTVLNNTKANLAPATENAGKLFSSLLTNQKGGFEAALSKLSGGAAVALASSTLNSDTKEGRDFAKTLATGDSKAIEKAARERIIVEKERFIADAKANQLLAEEAKKLSEVNNQTDLFIARMGNLSAVLDRASQAGEGFRKSNEALLSRRGGGAGIVSQTRTNVFDNTAGFTQGEVTKEALRINAFLGNNANSREATQGVVGAKQLQSKLPALLNALSAGVRGGGESETLLPQLINQNLAGIPKVLRDKLQSDIRTKFFANEQASPDDVANALAAGDVTDLQGSAQEVNGIFKKLVDVTNQKISEYEQVLDTFIQLNQEANAAQDNRLQILNESSNQEKALLGQQRLSVADRSRGFNTQLGQFAGRAGSNGSVQDLIARESALNSARAGSFSGAPDEVARQMANLTQSQQDSLRALELIAGNTERQNAIAEDLNSLIDSRREARQVFEDFASGSPTERRQIERNIELARRQNEGENFFGTRLKQASEGQRALQALVGATQGPDALKALDQKRINFLDRSGADRLFGAAGVNPGVGVGGLLNNNDALFQGQFSQLQELNRQRGAAAAGIEGINRRDANQFEQNGRDAFNSFQSNLQASLAKGGLLDVLNSTLSNLPETITLGGTVNHNININGGEVLAAMDPAIRKLVTDHVNFEINRRMNPLTGETGPA